MVPDLIRALREVADELYALTPGEFVAARDRRATEARTAGNRDLARQVKALRRPSAAAWAVNRLVREHPQEIDQLLDLGRRLRVAQEDLAGEELRELDRQRQAVLAALVREAAALAAAAGHPLGEPVRRQVQATLGAAMADPVAGAAVRSALLTGDLESTGFGLVEVDDAVAVPPDAVAIEQENAPPESSAAAERNAAERDSAARDPAARDSAATRRRRDEAERALEAAEEAVARAVHARADAQAQVDELTGRRAELAERIRDLTRQLQELREEDEQAAQAERRARRGLEAAGRAARAADGEALRARGRRERLR